MSGAADSSTVRNDDRRTYSPRFLSEPWMIFTVCAGVAYALYTAAIGNLVLFGWLAGGSVLFLIAGLALSTHRISLGDDGIRMANGSLVSWDDIVRLDGDGGKRGRLVLREPVNFGDPARAMKFISLRLYDRHWNRGGLGADLRRWAPHLFDGGASGQNPPTS